MKSPHLISTLGFLALTLGIVPNAQVASARTSDIVDFNIGAVPAPTVAEAPESAPQAATELPSFEEPEPAAAPTVAASDPAEPGTENSAALNFDPIPPAPAPVSIPNPAPPPPPAPPVKSAAKSPGTSDLDIFSGGSNSLVARTVGHAEGTRTPDGSKTRAYQGHSDPGNGVWNLGSFSFQHCREAQYNCSTAEEADVHQLRRLQGQADRLLEKADSLGISMSLEEELNGIDLANQAPAAALGEPGYTDWLKKARDKGLTDEEAILWARVSSYWDPAINGWNAPGLGNSEANITHDQNRRMTAIARALDIYNQQVAAGKIEPPRQAKAEGKPREEQIADRIISQDLSANN